MPRKLKDAPAADPKTCQHCEYSNFEVGEEAGYCRRYPPRIVVINDEAESALPVVMRDESCGEFKRRLQS